MIITSGIEIEGAWNELPLEFFNQNNHIYRNDTSIKDILEITCRRCGENKRKCRCNDLREFDVPDEEANYYNYVGEVASHPFEKIANLLNFMDRYYSIKSNKTCGIHYHIKVKNMFEYNLLNSKKFYDDFLKVMIVFGESRGIDKNSEFWRRLNGHNKEYCNRRFRPYQGGANQDPERYNIINYCYKKHGTVEFRLLPTFQSKKLAIEGIRFIHDFVNTWIILNSKKNKTKLKKEIVF